MSETAQTTPAPSKNWRQRLAAPVVVVLAVLCCLGAPLIVGVVGALSAGAWFGLGAGVAALLLLCLWAVRRFTAEKGC